MGKNHNVRVTSSYMHSHANKDTEYITKKVIKYFQKLLIDSNSQTIELKSFVARKLKSISSDMTHSHSYEPNDSFCFSLTR